MQKMFYGKNFKYMHTFCAVQPEIRYNYSDYIADEYFRKIWQILSTEIRSSLSTQ